MVKGVLFDMDGTLFDTERVSNICWKKAALERGYVIDDDFMSTLMGKNLKSIEETLKIHFDITDEAAKIVAGRQYYYGKFLTESEIPMKKGSIELMEYLKEHKIPMVVCTSTEKAHAETALKKSGIYEYFQGYVYGDMVTRTKPDPQGFHMAAQMIGIVPEECLVVEDSKNGVLAGKAAGGYIIYIPDMIDIPDEVKEGITAQLQSLDEIIGWIEKENA